MLFLCTVQGGSNCSLVERVLFCAQCRGSKEIKVTDYLIIENKN